ncbi:MAG: DUF3039 domain-containing protein [Actinomycetota bacterium]|nr:DUF3039 domain-containing protein [Actinomycetota bacterium]
MSIAEPGPDRSGPDTAGGGVGTDLLEKELQELLEKELTEDGDHDRFSHYVQKEKILESAVTGKPVIALCGKVWVPGRDPEKFPVCPDCKKIYERMK